jgi:hypothetical protein
MIPHQFIARPGRSMLKLSPTAEQTISELAQRHGFSREAVLSMLESVVNGNGTMAQFDHPEFGGSGQWMGGGMTMVSDMFNDALKARIGALCSELSRLVASDSTLARGESLFVPQDPGAARHWWPAELGTPTSSGAQNDVRYAHFAQARRLAIEVHGRVTVYDTLDHELGGFSQQQSRGSSLSFHSQHGLVDVASLPVVSSATAHRPARE